MDIMRQLIVNVTIIIVIITLSYLLAFMLIKRKDFLIYSMITLSLLWLGTGPAAYKYISSQQLRVTFDTILNPVIEHKDSFENEILVLPLPEHTVFAYRYSENAAAYYTSLTEDDIVKFFKDLASNDSFIIENPNLNNEKIMLKFTYKNTPYIVGLSESVKPKGYNLYIESYSK